MPAGAASRAVTRPNNPDLPEKPRRAVPEQAVTAPVKIPRDHRGTRDADTIPGNNQVRIVRNSPKRFAIVITRRSSAALLGLWLILRSAAAPDAAPQDEMHYPAASPDRGLVGYVADYPAVANRSR